MKLDPSQVRRWMANFAVAKEVERDLVQQDGPRSAWSVETALSLIAATAQTIGITPADPLREQQEAAVRLVWARLRARLAA
jgi:hypothetical protein